jgi:hypothetical protein
MTTMLQNLTVGFFVSCIRFPVGTLQHGICCFFSSCDAILYQFFMLLSYVLSEVLLFITYNSFPLLWCTRITPTFMYCAHSLDTCMLLSGFVFHF